MNEQQVVEEALEKHLNVQRRRVMMDFARQGRRLRDRRPKSPPARSLSLAERSEKAIVGAQYSPTLELWVGYLFDGMYLTTFEPRTSRARAMRDAWNHYDRIFHEERATRRWLP